MTFDPIAHAAAVKATPEEYVSIADVAREAVTNVAVFRAILACGTTEELKAVFAEQWIASADRPEFRVRLKALYQQRKKEVYP